MYLHCAFNSRGCCMPFRQEDAQEFLSFVMHQMHDELLKLDGQVPNGKGKATSLVSSTNEGENDDWEMVGPRNKTAITRTQTFIPSKLSEIFGGQWRSEVKARGESRFEASNSSCQHAIF